MSKNNGSKNNGSGPNDTDGTDNKIVNFPDASKRKTVAKQKAAQEKQWRKDYQHAQKQAEKARQAAQNPPFFNFDKITPFVRTIALALLVTHIALYTLTDTGEKLQIFAHLGFVPARLTGNAPYFWYTPLTAITHMFIHGSTMHLLFNLLMTVAFGIFFERTFGPRRAATFFFACGAIGALTYLIFEPYATGPVIGASGGTSGLFAAALLMMHSQGQLGQLSQKPPWAIIGFWIAFMIGTGLLLGGIAWQAHVGGFIAGVALYEGLRRGKLRF